MLAVDSLSVVAIGSTNFDSSFVGSAIGSIGWAKMIGNFEAIVVVVDILPSIILIRLRIWWRTLGITIFPLITI